MNHPRHVENSVFRDDQLLLAPNAVEQAASLLDATAGSPPLGESGEAYYCKRDDFTRYLEEVVNPARIASNLAPLDKRTAEECYRILNDFARKWGCKPIAENSGLTNG